MPHSPLPSPTGSGSGSSAQPETLTDKASFKNVIDAFDTEHIDFLRDAQRILDDIGGLGDFAGTDDAGQKFKDGYSKGLEKAVNYTGKLGAVYSEIAERLAGMKTSVDIANWANIQSLPKVSEPPKFSPSTGTITP